MLQATPMDELPQRRTPHEKTDEVISHACALSRERIAWRAAGEGGRAAVKPPWSLLPLDCLAHIARHSTQASYASMRLVCKAWRDVPCPFDSVCFVAPCLGDATTESPAAAPLLDTSSGALLPPTLHSLVTLQPCFKTIQLEGVTVTEGELRHLQRVGCVVSLSLARCLLQVLSRSLWSAADLILLICWTCSPDLAPFKQKLVCTCRMPQIVSALSHHNISSPLSPQLGSSLSVASRQNISAAACGHKC
jgi:hypothetical protein